MLYTKPNHTKPNPFDKLRVDPEQGRRTNYQDMEFRHLVEFPKDNAIFGTARENGSGKLRIFLIFNNAEGRVYSRNGYEDSWEEVTEDTALLIRAKVKHSRKFIPVYKVQDHIAF